MLYRIDKLIGMSVEASDGEIGKIRDVYFDDYHWAARYLVIETGNWLDDRKVLVSPFAVAAMDWDLRVVHVDLTRQRVQESPPLDTHKPVSRQHEMEFSGYYGYPYYWSGPLLWGTSFFPLIPTDDVAHVKQPLPGEHSAPTDPHLRSAKEVKGYHIKATDESIGHLEDLLFDNDNWSIRYVIIDTRNWWPGKHVVIPPQWINRLDWDQKLMFVDVTRDAVRHAPEYDPTLIEISRHFEANLYGHYQRPTYWH